MRLSQSVLISTFEFTGYPFVMSCPDQHTPFQSNFAVSSAIDTGTASSGQPASIRDESPGMFRLFALAAELRNIVYAHVLETNEPILMAPYFKDECLHPRMFQRVDLNQMKFVCEKLYEETSGLLPTRCAELIFPLRNDTPESASRICGRFIASAKLEYVHGIRRINVHERISYQQGPFSTRIFDHLDMSQLMEFAVQHPHALVNVFLHSADPKICQESLTFTVAGFRYRIARDREDLGYASAWLSIDSAFDEMAETWSGHAFDPQPFP